MKIYVVFGHTGEYSDHSQWPVRAYRDEGKAQERVDLATRRAKELEATRSSHYDIQKGDNEYDPDMQMDYTGTDYDITEVELEDA